MTDFSARARAALEVRGMSMRSAARELKYDVGYLSRTLNGKQQPSPQLAAALDQLLEANGELIAAAEKPTTVLSEEPPGVEGEIAHMRDTVRYFVAHDGRYGGDEIAPAAVRVWKTGQRQLDNGVIPEQHQRDYLVTVAEVAELAGWLLFDANRHDACRAATLEAHMLARHAGDRSMERFALTNLAMMDLEAGRPGESLRIADELLDQPRIPPRVALLARIRKGRALARADDRRRSLAELDAARGAMAESIRTRDPAWTWWVNECELSGHEGEALLRLGDAGAALPKLQRAAELAAAVRPNGRGALYYRVSLVMAYTAVQAWRDCEAELASIPPMFDVVSSGRNRRRLRSALSGITHHPNAPLWLSDLAREVRYVA
ncbi:hypothetical protein GCM10009799_37410 [Nocardiopsis rhodophaea]|uniref:HTH cro/C1-type domain-containing protein n=1 Tax=Nocardiopsis rhodophaea TaxID=280238 RepID=A0ABP5EW41_9ACTN